MTVAAGIEILQGGRLESGHGQVPVAARGNTNAPAGWARSALAPASEPGPASANWQSVLASLGVKVAGQQEQAAGTEVGDASVEASAEEPANEEPTTASLATLNRMGAAIPQGISAATAFSSQKQSIAGQAAIEPINPQAAARNLIALSKSLASSSPESAASSTVRSSQSPAESEEVQHPAHTGKAKWPQEPSTQTAPQLTAMPAQWFPTSVVDPISKGFETTAAVRNPTVSDLIATNGVENVLEPVHDLLSRRTRNVR